MYEKISFNGWPNCVRLYNKQIEVIATTDIGPRIVKFGYIGKQNFLYLVPEHAGKVGGREWLIYGGHRLWLAPEAFPFSYCPDNDEVSLALTENSIVLTQKKEIISGMVKQIEIILHPSRNEIKILHRVTNRNQHEVELSVWPITMLATGGRAIVPQEPYGDGNDFLLPARPLALWHYTKMNDPRWRWGEKYIQAIQTPLFLSEQKIGVMNKQGWMAYYLNGEVLIKKISFTPDVKYPDFGCNNEIYFNQHYLELETLSPLTNLLPGQNVEHIEYWQLSKVRADIKESDIEKKILPIVRSFQPNP